MSTRSIIEAACDTLGAGRLPDAEGRRLVARAARSLLDTPSRARYALLRQEAIRARDRLLIEIVRNHCADLRGVKPKADRIATWARRYEVSGWRHEQHATTCPDRLNGRPEGLIWRALKAHPNFPRDRQLREILTRAAL